MAGVNKGWARFYWYTIAGSAILITGIITYIKEKDTKSLREEAVRAKTTLGMALSGAGQPIISALAKVTSSSTTETVRAAIEVLINRTVAVAREECGQHTDEDCRIRAVFYRFEGQDLNLVYCEGRTGETPREAFSANGPPHDIEAIRVAKSHNGLVVDDLENHPPAHFADPKGRTYKSFIALPVRVQDHSYGMLIVDSDKPHTLSEVDKGFLVLLAKILAAGLAHQDIIEHAEVDKLKLHAQFNRSLALGAVGDETASEIARQRNGDNEAPQPQNPVTGRGS
jgi:GAF domain-containing protein